MKIFPIKDFFVKSNCFICGAFGSGKTEITINLSALAVENGMNVSLMDLDIVNLYFRSRDTCDLLTDMGVHFVNTTLGTNMMDLPALSPQVYGEITNKERKTFIDLGGDDVGARVLGCYKIDPNDSQCLFVLNTFRPFTNSPDKIRSVIKEIEGYIPGKVSGIILNSNIGSETDVNNIVNGIELVKSITGIPEIKAIGVWSKLLEKENISEVFKYNFPIIPLKRFMQPFENQ